MIFFIKFLLCLLFVLLSVAFFTLLERKFLGYIHNRLGPNKVSFFGLFQPFIDAIKLFSKIDFNFKMLNLNFYYGFSFFCLAIRIFLWSLISFWGLLLYSSFSLVFIICIVGIGVYFLLFMGWCRNTKYGLLGRYRSSAQRISYEIILIFCFLFIFYIWYNFNFINANGFNRVTASFFLCILIFVLWLISCLAECNRSPFDFSEGESELVSGFNTEFGGGLFSFIFIGEYRTIVFFSFLSSVFFVKFFFSFIVFCLISYIYLWVRGSYPRLRYDILIIMAWKSLCIIVLSSFFILFFYI